MTKLFITVVLTLASLSAFGGPGKEPCCCKIAGKTVHLQTPPCNDNPKSGWTSIFVTPGTCKNEKTFTDQYAGCLLNGG